jgi:hypothetical protein
MPKHFHKDRTTCASLRSSRYVLIRLLPNWPPDLELINTTMGQGEHDQPILVGHLASECNLE